VVLGVRPRALEREGAARRRVSGGPLSRRCERVLAAVGHRDPGQHRLRAAVRQPVDLRSFEADGGLTNKINLRLELNAGFAVERVTTGLRIL
jgi:hypothetical protein